MRTIGWAIAVLVLLAGCTQVDENPKFNPPEELPPWAYDAPFYYQPSKEMEPLETVGDGVDVYYTRERTFFIPHPGGCQIDGVPRVGIYYSLDAGATWNKAGYFGVEQTHFNFLAKQEGAYWIRFVGPGQGITECPPGTPHCIYMVDRKSPAIVLSVSPPPWEDEEQTIPRIYQVGQSVRLSWGVSDATLDPNSIRMSICFAEFPHNVIWSDIPQVLSEAGSITVELPVEAVQHKGIRFRLEARDKCGNIGLAMTDILHVAGEKKPTAPAPAEQPEVELELPPESAGGPMSAGAGEKPRVEMRPGWPKANQHIPRGSLRQLGWVPPDAADYSEVELQFSANDGLMWQTVATGLQPGRVATWTVPDVVSTTCRLRIVAVSQPPGEEKAEVTLVMSPQFVVDGE